MPVLMPMIIAVTIGFGKTTAQPASLMSSYQDHSKVIKMLSKNIALSSSSETHQAGQIAWTKMAQGDCYYCY